MSTLIAKNQTGSPITLNRINVVVPASGQVTISDFAQKFEIESDVSLFNAINTNQIVLNDGYGDLAKAISLNITGSAAGIVVTSTAPVNVTKATAAVGTSNDAARADHKHDITTAVVGSVNIADAAAEGSATSLARSDHVHAVTSATPVNVSIANFDGYATTFSRSDHIHLHGNLPGGNFHSLAVSNTSHGFMSATDKTRQSQVFDAAADFGFVGDLVTVFDGSCSTGAPTKITSATAAFTTNASVGQRITLAGAGTSGAMYVGVITNIDSATQVTVSPSISTTVSSKGLGFGTDNTAAINALVSRVNNATFPGVRVIFGQSTTNSYGFPVRAVFHQEVQIEGMGGGHTSDVGDYTRVGGTRLAWWGSSFDGGTDFGAFIEISPTGSQSLKRVSLRHCWLDCRNGDQNQALYGLKLASCHGFMIEDFFIIDALASSMWLNVASSPSEAKDTTRYSIKDFCFRQLDNPTGAVTTPILMTSAVTMTTSGQSLTVAANTLPSSGYIWTACNMGYPILIKYTGGGGTTTLTGCTVSTEETVNAPATVNGGNIVQAVPGNACGMILDGGTGANTCCGVIQMGQISHGSTWGPAAMEFKNSDSNDVLQVLMNGGSNTNDGAINRIRKPGVRFNGSATNSTLAARNNVFRGGSAGVGGVSAMGSTNAGARLAALSGPNYWDLYQLGNGESIPNVENNAYFDWSPNGGWRLGQRGSSSVADQAISAATLTLLTGSMVTVPPQGFQIGTAFKWEIIGTGGAVGIAANTITVRLGTAGTTADAAIATFTTTAGTAAASEFKITILLTVRTIGAAATASGECIINNSAASGFINATVNVLAGTMASFNTTTAQQFMHVDLTTGATKTATIKQVIASVLNPANP